MKCEATQELVVGGFTDPQGTRVGLGALLVGYFDGDDFVFAGKVGTGFDTKLLLDLRARLDAIEIADVAVHQAPRDCRGCARTGCGPRSSCRSRSSNGRCTASCATRACSASARQSRRARSYARRRDHASGKGPVPGRRHHQRRARGVLRGDRAGDAAAHPRPAGDDGAVSTAASARRASFRRTCRRAFPTWLERVEVPKKDGTVHHPLVTDTRSLLWLANQNCITPHVWTSRVPDLYHPDICVFDLDPSEDEPRRAARGGARPARSARRARPAELGEDVRLQGLSHRRAARRQERTSAKSRASRTRSARCWSSAIRSI